MGVGGRGGLVEGGLGVNWRRWSWHLGNKSMLTSCHSLGFSHFIYFLNCFTEEALLNLLTIFLQIKVDKSKLIYWGEFLFNTCSYLSSSNIIKAIRSHCLIHLNTNVYKLPGIATPTTIYLNELSISTFQENSEKWTLLNAFQDDRS